MTKQLNKIIFCEFFFKKYSPAKIGTRARKKGKLSLNSKLEPKRQITWNKKKIGRYFKTFLGELIKVQYEPNRVLSDLAQLARESRGFINGLPRQLHFLFRKWNSPDYASQIKIQNIDELKKSIEVSFNLLFLGIIIAALLLSASFVLVHPTVELMGGIPTFSFVGYFIAIILGVISFFNYIKK